MRRALLAILLASPLLAGDVDDAAATIRANDLRAHVEFLASDDLEGRATLQKGADTAATYLAAQMRRIGLAPAGADGTFFQEVPLWVSAYKYQYMLDLRLKRGGGGESFQAFRDYSIAPGSGHETVEGGIVFAGYGITAPEYGYDDYRGLAVKGKVVLVMRHEPQENDEKSQFEGRKLTRHATFESKIANAKAHGAAALLIMNDPLGAHLPLFDRSDIVPDTMVHRTSIGFEEGQHPKNEQGGLPVLFVDQATGAKILGREPRELEGIQRAMDASLQGGGFEVEGQLRVRSQVHGRLQTTERKIARNVAGVLPGSHPARMKEVVVVGAHYDHLGVYGSGDDRIFNGADDNASGTAGLLEVAEAFCALTERPDRTIVFVAFVGEEIGLLGSRWYAEHPLFPLADTAAMVNLDMIGRDAMDDAGNARRVMACGSGTSASWREILDRLAPASGLDLVHLADDPGDSDHVPFRKARIPVLFFHTGFHRDYHQVGDHADLLSYPKAEAVARLAFRASWEAARGKRFEFRDPDQARPERTEMAARLLHGEDLALRVLTEEEASGAGLDRDVTGLRVYSSRRKDLREGDIVLEVNDAPVKSVEEFLSALVDAKGRTASLFVLRKGRGCDFVHLKGADLEGWKRP